MIRRSVHPAAHLGGLMTLCFPYASDGTRTRDLRRDRQGYGVCGFPKRPLTGGFGFGSGEASDRGARRASHLETHLEEWA